jgi:hypothetical protein
VTEVVQGTAQDVLDWVGDDPARAQQALDAELAGPNRSTLIPKLEAIASKEAPVSETTTEVEAAEEVPAPTPPTEVNVVAEEATISPIHARDTEVEVPDDASLAPVPEEGAEDEAEPIGAEQVEYLQVASTSNGVVVSLNGTAYAFGPQLAATLKGAVDKAVVGLTL